MHQIAYTSPGERKANTGILPWRGTLHIAWLLILCWGGAGCSTMRTAALNQVGDSLAGSGTAFASDDDPEFIRLASPFSLKMMEVVLEQNPMHALSPELLAAWREMADTSLLPLIRGTLVPEGTFDEVEKIVHGYRQDTVAP